MLVDEGSQKLLLTAGKKGILWKLDRTNGKFLDYVPMVFQNVFTSIDRKTGRGTYRSGYSDVRSRAIRVPHARPSRAAITGRPRAMFPKTI